MNRSSLSLVGVVGCLTLWVAGPVACGGDDTTSSTTSSGSTTSTTVTTSTSSGGGSGGMGSGGMGMGGGGGGSGGITLQECIDAAMGDMCSVCACNSCLDQINDCNADMGCTEIRECAQENNCTGTECLGPCGDVIMMYQGSIGLAQALSDCVDMGCAMDCM